MKKILSLFIICAVVGTVFAGCNVEDPIDDKSNPADSDAAVDTNHHAISVGINHMVGLRKDGTVMASFPQDFNRDLGKFGISEWKDIVSVAAGGDAWGYDLLTVGLKEDGTVVYTDISGGGGEFYAARSWKEIIGIAAGVDHIVGLRKDGTVVATGAYSDHQCDVSDWTDIVAISAGVKHTVGLRKDGTVVATGKNNEHQGDVSEWKDIVAVSAGGTHTVGLRDDGTVIAVGDNDNQQCDVSSWNDMVAIAAGFTQTLGLKKDGTVISTNQEDLSGWTDIVEVSSAVTSIGLKKDGTVISMDEEDSSGWRSLSDWKDIGIP